MAKRVCIIRMSLIFRKYFALWADLWRSFISGCLQPAYTLMRLQPLSVQCASWPSPWIGVRGAFLSPQCSRSAGDGWRPESVLGDRRERPLDILVLLNQSAEAACVLTNTPSSHRRSIGSYSLYTVLPLLNYYNFHLELEGKKRLED